jgi:soluble lytic murein transglycosylase-like protein
VGAGQYATVVQARAAAVIMKIPTAAWVLGGVGLIYWLTRTQTAQTLTQAGADIVTATVSGWKAVEQGPHWVPVLNTAEAQYGIPTDLLARIAYQESHFRPDIISGETASPAGALGLMQMLPRYFGSVNRVVPFNEQDTLDQINEAAQLLAALYAHFQDWGLAIAAYNDGRGNIDQYVAGNRALPQETASYVNAVLTDVPIASPAFSA